MQCWKRGKTSANRVQHKVQTKVQAMMAPRELTKECKTSAIRVQFDCNSSATLKKSATRVQKECKQSARKSAKRVQTECNKSAINNGPGVIDQRVQNRATQNAQTSAIIDHI